MGTSLAQKDFRRVGWLEVESLFVDNAYQREPSPAWVAKTAKKFDSDLFDPLAVSKRTDDRFAVIDGQGRLGLARAVGMQKAPCLIYEGLTPEDESALFRKFQSERRQLRPFDEYRAALFEAEEWAVDVKEAAERWGFTVAAHGDSEQSVIITAVRVMHRVREMDEEGEVLEATLRVISQAWNPGIRQRTDASIVEGLGVFVQTHAEKYDEQRLNRVLSGVNMPAGAFLPELIRAKAAQERVRSAGKHGVVADGMFSRRWSVTFVIEKAYNDSITAEGSRVGLLRKSRRPMDRTRAERKRLRESVA